MSVLLFLCETTLFPNKLKTSTDLITVLGVLKFQSELDGLGYTLTFINLVSSKRNVSAPITTLPRELSAGSAKGPLTANPYCIVQPAANSAAVAETVKSPVLLIETVLFTTVAKPLLGSKAFMKATGV